MREDECSRVARGSHRSQNGVTEHMCACQMGVAMLANGVSQTHAGVLTMLKLRSKKHLIHLIELKFDDH